MLTFPRFRYSLALTAAAASWGVATVISKRAVEEIPPLTLLPIQLAVSFASLILWIGASRQRIDWSPGLRRLGALGVLNPGLSYSLGLLGLSYITASRSVLLWAVEPLMILALGWWLLQDRISPGMVGASVLALVGVFLTIFDGGSRGSLPGTLLTLAGVAACAVYTVVARKLIDADSTLVVVAVQQGAALAFALLLLAVTTMVGKSEVLPAVSGVAWISAIASGGLYYAVAFSFYLTGLRRVSASVAGTFINLIPVFGIAAGHALLGERLGGRQWLGAVTIVFAVFLVVRAQSPHAQSLDDQAPEYRSLA